jgi:hypothetical protein
MAPAQFRLSEAGGSSSSEPGYGPDCDLADKRLLKRADIYIAPVSLDTIGERIDRGPIRNLQNGGGYV